MKLSKKEQFLLGHTLGRLPAQTGDSDTRNFYLVSMYSCDFPIFESLEARGLMTSKPYDFSNNVREFIATEKGQRAISK